MLTAKKLLMVTLAVILSNSAIMAQPMVENDPGVRDTLSFNMIPIPTFDPLQNLFKLEMWVYNDSTIKVAAGGFSWDNPKFKLDSAVASPMVEQYFDGGVFFYDSASIDKTNQNQRFQFGGFRVVQPGIPGDIVERRLWATYYFSADSLLINESLTIDTVSWSVGTELMYVSKHNLGYPPYFDGPFTYGGDPDTAWIEAIIPDTIRQHDSVTVTIVGFNTSFGSSDSTVVEFFTVDTLLAFHNARVIDDTLLSVDVYFDSGLPTGLWSVRVKETGDSWEGGYLLNVKPRGLVHPNDPGLPDTLMFRLARTPAVSQAPQQIELELWVFSDSLITLADCGFGWQSEYLTLDSATPTPLVDSSFDQFIRLEEPNGNVDKRFSFRGVSNLSPGLPGDASNFRHWATYYFTLDQWQPPQQIVIDSLTWTILWESLQFTNVRDEDYRPIGDLPFIYQEYDTLQPGIASITPSTILAPDTIRATITGENTNFEAGSTSAYLVGEHNDTLVGTQVQVVSPTTLFSTFEIPAWAEGSIYDVVVTTPLDGSIVGADMFQVMIADSVSTVRHVPGQYATIQAAIDAANEADTVLVAPGRYFENLIFRGYDIVLASEFILDNDSGKIHTTVIDGSSLTRGDSAASVISIENGESPRTRIVGLTIENGYGQQYPFQEPWTDRRGGGIHIKNANASIDHCIIQKNRLYATHTRGGGIYAYNPDSRSTVNVRNSLIALNVLEGTNTRDGAGLCAIETSVRIENNSFQFNDGNAIALFDLNGSLKNNRIVDNDSTGLFVQGNAVVQENVILRNAGDGVYANYATLNTDHNVIADNGGYGVYLRASALFSVNNTIVSNAAGGIVKTWHNYRLIHLTNDILWYNGDGFPGSQIHLEENANLRVQYCDIEGGVDDILLGPDSTSVEWGLGNINLAPKFVDTLNYDYTLAPTSPCIDAGHPHMVDPDGSRRDMGAIPSGTAPPLFTVDPNLLQVELNAGYTTRRAITVTNTSDHKLELTFQVEPIVVIDSTPPLEFQYDRLGPEIYDRSVAWPSASATGDQSPGPRNQRDVLPRHTASAEATILFFDDMESGGDDWTTWAVGNSPDWDIIPGLGVDSSYAWHVTSNASFGEDNLESIEIDLRSVDEAMLTFDHRYEFDDCGRADFEPDGGVVEIWDDNSSTWQRIFPVGGYPYVLDDICSNPLAHRNAYSHNSGGTFEQAIFNLSPWTGNTVKIRFRAGWDCGECRDVDRGWTIDNVMVTNEPVLDWLAVEPQTLTILAGQSTTLSAVISAVGKDAGLYRGVIVSGTEPPQTRDQYVVVEMTVTEDVVHPTNEWISLYCDQAMLDSLPIPSGTVISAYDPDGILCGRDTIEAGGRYGFMLIYRDDPFTDRDEGAEPGDPITLRLGETTVGTPDPVIWTSNGDRFEACSFTSMDCRQYTLQPGWHLISWNLAHKADIQDFMLQIDGCIDVIMGFDGEGLMFDPLLPQFSTLDSVDYHNGYWIRTTCETSFDICGSAISEFDAINIEPGWNLVSYWPTESHRVDYALQSLSTGVQAVLTFDDGARVWVPGDEFSTLDSMTSGLGYWIRNAYPGRLEYPGFQPPPTRRSPGMDQATAQPSYVTNRWMSLYGEDITLDGQALSDGALIEVYDADGLLCGLGKYEQQRLPFLPVYASAEKSDERALTLNIDGVPIDRDLSWLGHGERLQLSALKSSTDPNLPQQFGLAQNYPNPFNPATTIEFTLPRRSDVRLEVYNIMGQRVTTILQQPLEAGDHRVEWDGRSDSGQPVASGVYFYRLTAEDFVKTRKMLLLK